MSNKLRPLLFAMLFLRYVSSIECNLIDQITLAEEFKDWIHDSVYKDLLDFENDIAHISSLIVIVLESPGALAELGLFVRNKVLNKKTSCIRKR